jgi:hypothetical protein
VPSLFVSHAFGAIDAALALLLGTADLLLAGGAF